MASSSALEFMPTQGELSVVAAILEYARSQFGSSSSLDGVPQIDSNNAVEILQRSGLSTEDLANIWSLSDEDGDGNLSERELAIAVRLIGWAQSGKPVNRSFVNYSNGPLPMLKDVWENKWDAGSEPVQLPPVNVLDKIEFNRSFREAGPVDGLLDGDKARDIYLKTNLSFHDLDQIWNLIDREQRGSLNNIEFAVGMYLIQAVKTWDKARDIFLKTNLSFHDLDQIWNLIDREQRGSLNNIEFAVGMYLIQAVKTCQLTVLPASVPPHIFDQFFPKAHSPFAMPRPPPKSEPLPWRSPSISVKAVSSPSRANGEDWDVSAIEQAEARTHFDTLDADKKGLVDGDESARFMIKCFRLSPSDIAQIWDLVDLRRDNQLNVDQLAVAIHLIHRKLDGHELPSLELPSSLTPPSMRTKPQNHVRRASAPGSPKRPPPPIPPVSRKPSLSTSSPTSPNLKRTTSFSPTTSTLRPPKALKPELKNRMSIAAIPEASSAIPRRSGGHSDSDSLSIPAVPQRPTTFYIPNHSPHTPTWNGDKALPPSPISSPPTRPSPPIRSNSSIDEETISELRAETKQLRGHVEELMIQLKEQNHYRARNGSLKEDNKRLQRRLQETEQALTQVIQANEGADRTEELSREVTRLTQLLTEHENTESELRETLHSVAELSQENQLMKQKYEDLKFEKGSLEKELEEAGIQMQNLQGEKNSISTRLTEMEKLLADPQAKGSSRRELQMLLKDVTKENELLKSREREMQQQMSTILLTSRNQAQVDDLKRGNSSLKLQVEELEEVLRGMQASSSDNVLRRRVNELEREKETLNVQVSEMTRRVTGVEELSERKIQELQQRVRELEVTNQNLRHQQAMGGPHDENAPPPAYEEISVAS
ncbi:hypothetical protein AN958_12656 [Leucoagaricus sp. SymC.cos]|nr:hypothetical protein AN958_12656 [Leucoagaricus sp. SymC.cos]